MVVLGAALAAGAAGAGPVAQRPVWREIGGVYPHLAMFNSGQECGTGAVVPWAGRLWAITYAPHQPFGSDDKLYEVDANLDQTVRAESIGGTPANRFIHRESNQLFIGPYVIDGAGTVRVIPYAEMPGRPTGNARHLTDPSGRVYAATMEEGLYEVDVRTLAVRELFEDANAALRRKALPSIAGPLLPGYHGKGLYSGQGRLVYANNGEYGGASLPPDAPSGCLAEWDGAAWKVVRRNQFTEVTGPGGLAGNANPDRDPIWSIGWDHKSLVLMLLDGGSWSAYRLPKASHAYDGAHGWNTEWPRIRDIGEDDLLMTMHGMLWRFPKTFSRAKAAGIAPRSTHLRVVGDFARWSDRVVFGSDDTAKSEFTNTRLAKGRIAGPGQSQSNLWFVEPGRLDRLGAPLGRGGVWVREDVRGGEPSEPFLFSGFEQRMLHLAHESGTDGRFVLEVDRAGDGRWTVLRTVSVPARGYVPVIFDAVERGAWIRVTAERDCRRATAFFHFSQTDRRPEQASPLFAGLPAWGTAGGGVSLVWARDGETRTLLRASGDELSELDAQLALTPLRDPQRRQWMKDALTAPKGVLQDDAASIIYVDEAGARWRLPRGRAGIGVSTRPVRVDREVSTERDLFNAGGIFYELPSNNAGGMAMVRPIATHNLDIDDYASWRGLTVMSVANAGAAANDRLVRTPDGGGLWLGVSDDLWQLGAARGVGGPWSNTPVTAGRASDPYLMTGFSRKVVRLSHDQGATIKVRVEVDVTGTGLWVSYAILDVPPGRVLQHRFPDGFGAYWVRFVPLADARATAQLIYGGASR
jgi:hypothetical protein